MIKGWQKGVGSTNVGTYCVVLGPVGLLMKARTLDPNDTAAMVLRGVREVGQRRKECTGSCTQQHS